MATCREEHRSSYCAMDLPLFANHTKLVFLTPTHVHGPRNAHLLLRSLPLRAVFVLLCRWCAFSFTSQTRILRPDQACCAAMITIPDISMVITAKTNEGTELN